MLKSLYIKNYAIIDELNIDFNDGFNVFTGETGAGKSIIVGALSYLVRGKADTSIINSNADKAIIEGVFSIDEYMKPSLDENDIDYDDELIVRRTISRDGKNTIKINQCSVTLNYLTELLADHIDIHSQKDSQYLLNKKNHLKLLDKYCHNNDALNEYKKAYEEYNKQLNEYNDLLNNTYNEADLDYYAYDLKELEDANLKVDEETELEEKENRYKQSEKYITSINSCLSLFEDENGIKDRLNILIKELNLNDEEIEEVKSKLEESYYSINDQMSKLKDILYSFDEDNLDIEKIEERLYLYSKLKRKHNTNTEGLIKLKDELDAKIKFFEDKDNVLNEKKKVVDDLYNKAFEIASNIHEIRLNKALDLQNDILTQTSDLMLNNVVFKVQIDEVELNANGIDDVEFFISLNKGEDLKPLKNVASGGEISRLMLALKTIFTSLSDTTLVIFDEIDTGVSGKVGLAEGIKMATIGKYTQVLSISHLASVAACANTHFYIYKENSDTSTNTRVRQLNKDEIIAELASISNSDTTEESIAAAEQLYKTAQESIN